MEWNYPVGAYDAPWLSILIPAYNAESYIEECLRSIFSQSLHGVEIIVVNDCSTDQTVSITEQLVASFPGASLKFLHNETNRGLSFTRNRMLDICNGQYVWFVDADDCVRPDAITQLKRIVDEHAPDFVVCDFADYHKNQDDSLTNPVHKKVFNGPERRISSDRNELLQGLFKCHHMHSWSKITKRKVWGTALRFPDGRYFEDIATTPILASKMSSYYYEPTAWIDYRKSNGSIVTKMDGKKCMDMMLALVDIAKELRRSELGLSPVALYQFDLFCIRQSIYCFKGLVRDCGVADRDSTLSDCLGHMYSIVDPLGWPGPNGVRVGDLWLRFRLKKWVLRAKRLAS